MLRILLVGFLAGLTACGGSSNNNNSNGTQGATCNANSSAIEQMAKASDVKTLKPGSYKVIQGDFIHNNEGHVARVVEDLTSNRQVKIECPQNGILSPAISDNKVFRSTFTFLDQISVNQDGEVELPEQFTIYEHELMMRGSEVILANSTQRASSLREVGGNKAALRSIPGLVVTPVTDGFVLSIKENKLVRFILFKLVKAAEEEKPGPGPAPKPDPGFTKAQCLEFTNANLAGIDPEGIRFSRDCSTLYVVKTTPEAKVRAVAWSFGSENCNRNTQATVQLTFRNTEIEMAEKLKPLNPELKVVAVMPGEGTNISYRREVQNSTMQVPTVRSEIDSRDRSKTVVYMNGALSAQIELVGSLACRHRAALKKYESENKVATEALLREFAVEYQ